MPPLNDPAVFVIVTIVVCVALVVAILRVGMGLRLRLHGRAGVVDASTRGRAVFEILDVDDGRFDVQLAVGGGLGYSRRFHGA